jgi:ankyrin repeat protein
MKKIALLTSLALTTLAADPAAAPAKDAQQLLRDGLFEEEANLDLGKAAAAYAEVIANYDVQRQISGTAVFRLAEIRAKQGKKDEAAALYQRVVAEFATFEQIAKPARERLAKLGAVLPDAASKESGLTQAESDELVKLREMAANSPDLLNASDGKDTPLNRAAANGWVKAAEFLLGNGAQIERTGSNRPLITAAQSGHKRVVELLLEKGANIEVRFVGLTPLIAACGDGRASVVRLLIERGADVNGPWKDERTPLHAAVESGDLNIVRLLLEKGAKPDVVMKRGTDSFTPLGLAKSKEMAALLLEFKATPDLGLADGVVQPLTNAVLSGNTEFVELLLQRLEKVSDPQPLFIAIERKNLAILEKLLGQHSNVDGLDGKGRTPLLFAAAQSPEFVPALLKAGASANAKAPSGETALFHVVVNLLSLNRAPGSNPSQAAVSVARPPSGRRVVLPTPAGIPQPNIPQPQPVTFPNPQSSTPLTTLKREELQDIIKALIAHGADINAPVGTTPVLWHTSDDIELFDWLVSLGADPYAKNADGVPFIPLIGNRESRIALEARYVYPKSAPKDGVLINKLSGEPIVMRPTAEFEPLPTFAEALARTFPASGKFGFESKYDVTIYRMGAKGRYEEAEKVTVKPLSASAASDAATWPKLQAGDVLIIPMTNNGNPQNASVVQDWLVPALAHHRGCRWSHAERRLCKSRRRKFLGSRHRAFAHAPYLGYCQSGKRRTCRGLRRRKSHPHGGGREAGMDGRFASRSEDRKFRSLPPRRRRPRRLPAEAHARIHR